MSGGAPFSLAAGPVPDQAPDQTPAQAPSQTPDLIAPRGPGRLRLAWGLARVGGHLLTGAVLLLGSAALARVGAGSGCPPGLVQWWHRRLCRILRLRVEVRGEPAPGPVLLLANHVSWLDVPALGALGPMDFLAKSEVRAWPLVGWMAGVAGTLFIERGGGRSDLVAGGIRDRLDRGGRVLIFPEGTTTDGSEVRRFHPRLLAAAQEVRVAVQPVALAYRPAPGRPAVAPFIGDDAFPDHLLRVLAEPGLHLEVSFHPPIPVDGRDRRSLAEEARCRIRAGLGLTEGEAGWRVDEEISRARGSGL